MLLIYVKCSTIIYSLLLPSNTNKTCLTKKLNWYLFIKLVMIRQYIFYFCKNKHLIID